jgi:methionyl-tRNA formyltransferase
MLQTIILLAGTVEQLALIARLSECNRALAIAPVETPEDLAAIGPAVLANARLIGFATPVIVPGAVLRQLGYGAYNFHPGPPSHPGLCPAHYAAYEGATAFGATAHKMAERVDAGPIVAVTHFAVPQGSSVRDIELQSYHALARLFWDLAPLLATREQPLAELAETWGQVKSSRRSLEALCSIAPDIEPAELARRIAAFGHSPFGITPTVTLHGHKFRLVAD